MNTVFRCLYLQVLKEHTIQKGCGWPTTEKAGRYVFEVYAKGTGSPRDAKQKDLQRQQRLRCGNKAPASR